MRSWCQVRNSLYFYPSVLEKLEEVWYELRRKRHQKISRWKIVNLILQEYLGDVDYVEKLIDRK